MIWRNVGVGCQVSGISYSWNSWAFAKRTGWSSWSPSASVANSASPVASSVQRSTSAAVDRASRCSSSIDTSRLASAAIGREPVDVVIG